MDSFYDLLMRGDLDASPQVETNNELPPKALGNFKRGDMVTIKGGQFIVLGGECGGIALLGTFSIGYGVFGETTVYRYSMPYSKIRKFYDEIVSEIGEDKIICIPVDLTALDGTNITATCPLPASIPTLDIYRKNRDIIARGELPCGNIWLATRYSADVDETMVISDNGNVDILMCSDEGHVIPYIVFTKDVLVD